MATKFARIPNEPTLQSDPEQSWSVVRLKAHDALLAFEQNAPPHVPSCQPAAGRATSRMRESFGKNARQVPGHEIPRGTLVTFPCPETTTDRTRGIGRVEPLVTVAPQATIAVRESASVRRLPVTPASSHIATTGAGGSPAGELDCAVVKRQTLALGLVAIALIALPAIALGSAARTATNSQSYQDSTGEDPAAPDITSIGVTNDDTGAITFQINIANRPAFTPDMLLDIFLDTDKNASTGASQFFGADYLIELQPGAVGLFQWNGSDFVGALSQSSLTFSYGTTGATIRVNALDLNRTKGFNFATAIVSGLVTDPATGNVDFTNAHDDIAPDTGHGTFAYQVITKLTLTGGAFTTSPTPVKAGKSFSAGLAVTESDTNAGVDSGTISCAAKIAGKAVPVKTKRLVDGIAVCVWSIPKTARGKTIRGSIALAVQGTQTSRAFSARIG